MDLMKMNWECNNNSNNSNIIGNNDSVNNCGCIDGYSYKRDFYVDVDVNYCNINIYIIKVFWIIVLLIYVVEMVFIQRFIYYNFFFSRDIRKKRLSTKYLFRRKNFYLVLFKPKNSYVFLVFLSSFYNIILSCLKIYDPVVNVIGKDILTTFCFSSGTVTSTTAILIFIRIIIKFLSAYLTFTPPDVRSKLLKDTKFVERATPIMALFLIIAAFSPFIIVTNPEYFYEITFFSHFVLAVFGLFYCYLLASKALKPVLEELSFHLNEANVTSGNVNSRLILFQLSKN